MEDIDLVVNERTTEDIVREHLKLHGSARQKVEEQGSSSPLIRRALAAASKKGSGIGKPEFIVTLPEDAPKLVIVVECKADTARHSSPSGDCPVEYAVDGVLHYAAHLASSFDVVAIAVSGTDHRHLKVSTFRQLKGASTAEPLPSPVGPIDRLLPIDEYRRLLTYDPAVRARTHAELMAFSRVLHNYMRDYAKLSESEKPLVVSGILIALRDEVFKRNWSDYKPRDLARELFSAIGRTARDSDIPEAKREIMLAPYSFIRTHPELSKVGANGETPLLRLIADLDEHVRPFLDAYHDVDVIGQFYGEFLRYTGGDKRGLGIVLTPKHLTELFAKIANVGPHDTVVDTCAGTGGFLIAAMTEMDAKAGHDDDARRRIREHQLVGVEQQPHMFALAVSNMLLRGDGKANLYQGSCFEPEILAQLEEGVPGRFSRPNIGLINPPYSQKGEGLHELDFVETLLACLRPGGLAVAVVPMSCAITPHPTRRRLLANHTLVAVMSLPNDLFAPVGTVPCMMVFRAHQAHQHAPQPTWFGYWKHDGFVKTKDRGRIDLRNEWPAIRDQWLEEFHGRAVRPGRSVLKFVGPEDEWCAEAYMETDYSGLTAEDFNRELRKFALYQLMHQNDASENNDDLPGIQPSGGEV
ncbi:class I SAM-dependent DNA methyltransferase [Micromonospora sp. AMSO31t]|uniref:HsdM family class I SAM-dependent methyltransferase n=1 Tax=Micromonospora sp. AMSO31t TaxID=2650566 RepID=UPI001788C213|nr:N-6 DNA methylase [Micromonospora sp. AMSO31t]